MLFRTLVLVVCFSVALPAATIFLNSSDFGAAIATPLTDHYSPADGYPAGFGLYSNSAMTAFFGEAAYTTTGHSDNNIVSGERYCAGCNGSFGLDFTSTSVGDSQGVFGVGLDITSNDAILPYWAYITFGDDTGLSYGLASGAGFFGVTDTRRIRTIHFGLSNGLPTTSGSFQIDNLTIGAEPTSVPEPSMALPVALVLGMLGLRCRRSRASRT